ncbi:MAG: amino acid synthesis family protein, partial [Roseomonas sp.]|nr:amino acid synthesis family protein [Roseomonas sp.]
MSQDLVIRKTVLCVEEVRHDGGPVLATPILKGWCAVVLRNPFAGRYEPDLMWMMEAMKPIGLMVAERLLAGLGGDPARIEAVAQAAQEAVAGHTRAIQY